MHKVYLILRREYLERVRTKAFLIMTVLVPLIMLGFTVVPQILAGRSSSVKRLTVVASDMRSGEVLRRQLEAATLDDDESRASEGGAKSNAQARKSAAVPQDELAEPARFSVTVDTNTSEAERAALSEQVRQKTLGGVIWAPREAIQAKKVTFITGDIAGLVDAQLIRRAVARAAREDTLLAKGMTSQEIAGLWEPIRVDVQNPAGGAPTDIRTTFMSLIFLITILYVTVLLYGINVMNAVLEEKTSRVMEVMLATTGARELMAGKIIGVGAVGLTQIGIWVLTGLVLSSGGLVAAGGELRKVISIPVLVFFPVFFLLGFALYSSLYAAIGAMVNSQQEGQQLQQLVAMPLALSFILLFPIIQSPNSPVSVAISFFPLTAPLMMFARIALQSAPWWQVGLCIALLLATIYAIVVVCGKIYRVGILMYGKKPTLPEILKWIKYA